VATRGVEACQPGVDDGPLPGVHVRPLAERDARVRTGEPELDPVERALGAQARDQLVAAGGAGAARVGVRDRLFGDRLDGLDREHAHARAQRAAGPDGGAAPAPEGERHLARLDGAERRQWEQHRGRRGLTR
jgi:hypothetical protein